MKWSELGKQAIEKIYSNKIKTDIECPYCGKKEVYRRTDVIFSSDPQQYRYECECGWMGYSYEKV